nr:immunoglobulin heavy chain junction region [Mus musculus]
SVQEEGPMMVTPGTTLTT